MSDTTSSTQVLARKWRPRELSTLVGQEHVVRALRHALQTRRLHHAYLFTGTRGVGKTTLARILAKALNCETGVTDTPCGQCNACREIDQGRFVDLLEVDAATNTGVDEMRDLLENAAYAPTAGRYKVYVIDEVHMLSKSAFNAMLKTLEEPPPHMLFILATTDPQKIPVTVLSRCLQFNLKQMPPQHVVEHLQRVLAAEGIPFDVPALQLIGRAAQGSMRDALSLTDQAIAHGAGQLSLQSVQDMLGAVDQRHLIEILDALAAQDGAALLAVADDMSARSLPLGQALQNLAALLYRLSIAHLVPNAIAEDDPDRDLLLTLCSRFTPAQLQLYYQIASHGRRELVYAPDEATGFGMCLLRMLAFLPQGTSPDTNATGISAGATGGGSTQRPGGVVSAPPRRAPVQAVSSPVTEAPTEVPSEKPVPQPASGATVAAPAVPVAPASPAAPAARPSAAPARNPLDALGQLLPPRELSDGASPRDAGASRAQAVSTATLQGRGASAAAAALAVSAVPAMTEPEVRSHAEPKPVVETDRLSEPVRVQPAAVVAAPAVISDAEAPRTPVKLSLVHPVAADEAHAPGAAISAASIAASAPASVAWSGQWPDVDGWPAFVEALPATGLLRQMLDRSQFSRVQSDDAHDTLHLTVAVKAYLDPSHAQRASALLSEITGRSVTVQVTAGPADITAQARADARQRQRQAEAEAAIQSDPFVRALQESLGASIVPGSVRPL